MAKPKNLKKAFEQGFEVYNIDPRFEHGRKLRVDLRRRFFRPNANDNYVCFFINKDYFVRKYPIRARNFGIY